MIDTCSSMEKTETRQPGVWCGVARAAESASLLSKTVLTINHRAGEDGKLYGSVTTKEIAERVLPERQGMCVLPVVADRDELLSRRRSRVRRRLHGRHRHCPDEPCGRECLKQHPFKDNVTV